jgi:hypothetical protein
MYKTSETKSDSPSALAYIHPSRSSRASRLKKPAGSEPEIALPLRSNNFRQKQSEPKASPCRVLPSPKRVGLISTYPNSLQLPSFPFFHPFRVFSVFRGQKSLKTFGHSAFLSHSTPKSPAIPQFQKTHLKNPRHSAFLTQRILKSCATAVRQPAKSAHPAAQTPQPLCSRNARARQCLFGRNDCVVFWVFGVAGAFVFGAFGKWIERAFAEEFVSGVAAFAYELIRGFGLLDP